MGNAFDQFDKKPGSGNPFDRFDREQKPRNGPGTRPARDLELGLMHPEFDASSIAGYDPSTGMVENSKSDSGILAGLTSAVEGMPILGPYLQAGSESAAAGIGSVLSGQPYDKVRGEIGSRVDSAQAANPVTSTASGIGGAVLGTLPAMLAAPEMFGVGAGTLIARTAASVFSGGAIGGADAAVRSGGDLQNAGLGALAGFGTGAVAPGIAGLIGKGFRATADFISRQAGARIGNLTPQAVGQLTKAMEADGIPIDQIQARLAQLGPDATIADLGPNLQQTAAGLVAMPGEARSMVQNAMRARDAGANARIIGTLDKTIGRAPVPSDIRATIDANQRAVGPHYREVFANARHVDTSGIARYLDREGQTLRGEAQRGVQRIRTMLNRVGTDELETNPVTLLETRKAVDGMLETVQDSNARNALQTARQAIDDQLRASVPGIKEADAKFAELARQNEALQRGQTVLSSGREAPRPAELAREVERGALPQGEMVGPSAVPVRLREGARAEIERIVGTNANDRVALQRLIKGEGDWNRARLATLFGQDRADSIINLLDRERLFAETSNFVTRNSATAARQQAVRGLTGDGGDSFGIREGYMAGGSLGAARSAGVRTVETIVDALKGAGRKADHEALARGLLSKDRETVIKALNRGGRSYRPQADVLSKVARALMLGPGSVLVGPLIQNGTGR